MSALRLLLVVVVVVSVAVQARCPGPPPLGLSALNDTQLTALHLDNCSVNSLHNVTFAAFSCLQLLNLAHNRIAQLPQDSTVFNVTGLRVLDLSHNLIHAIYGSPFRTLRALRVLNLSGNAIDVISVDGFRGPESLQSLDLSCNNITELPDRVFVPLMSLQHLNLSGNRLQTLADGCFGSLLRLQQLDVSWNQLNHVAPSTLQSLPSLARLLLADNPALGDGAKEAALLVGTGRRLQTVDASRTGLKHVPATLTHSVRTLRLAGNSIRAVRCGDLDSYPLLQLLDLTTNSLDEIEEDALGRLEMLAVLYLTDNKLRAIPRSLPDRLEILHLEYNRIEQIVSGDLLGLPKLEVLLLNDNAIKVVQEGAFSQVTSLVTLDLSRNPISILPGDTLAGPARLQMLRLAELTVDPPAEDMAFPVPAPEHLVRLDLTGSVGLARQLLADTAALAAFRELQDLNLANTALTNIRSDLLHYLPQMHEFHLTGNQLNCTGLLWLALWMRRQDQPEYRKVACASPPELYGTLVVDLQDTYVQELPLTTSSTTTSTSTSTSTMSSSSAITTSDETTAVATATTERAQNETAPVEETTIYSNVQHESALNNTELVKQADRSTVRGLQNTVKSSAAKEKKEMEERESDRRMAGLGMGSEAVMAVTAAAAAVPEHRSSSASPATDQLHLFPIAPEQQGLEPEMGPSTDRTETVPSVTDGHIDEINPSDNRVATEPSNYTTNAPPPSTSQAPQGDRTTDAEPQLRYANQPDNFFRNRSSDVVTGVAVAAAAVAEAGVQPTPGLFALLAAALGLGAALCSLVSHVRRRRRRARHPMHYDRHQDIEISSLASEHELW